MRINSNNLFAFQVLYYYNLTLQDERFFDPLPSEDDHSNDTFYIPPNSNLYDSNFFSTYNDKSQFFKLNDTTTEKQTEEDNRSYFTVDLEFEKQVNILTDCDDEDDDLNDAKLNLNNEISLLSSQSNTNPSTQQIHNMTTPLNFKRQINEIDDKLSTINPSYYHNGNNRMFSQQSFSSLFEKLPHENSNIKSNANMIKGRNTINNTNKLSMDFQSNSVDLNFTNLTNTTNKYPNNIANTVNAIQNNKHFYHYNQNKYQFIPYSFCKYNNQTSLSRNHLVNSSMPVVRMFPYMNKNEDTKPPNHKIPSMIKDQSGSKIIQKKIEEKNPEFLYKLYDNIKNNLYDIMTDQFGNYVIQKYVENCDKKIISKMLKQIQFKLYDISINSYGTRALQKMLENISLSLSNEDMDIIIGFTNGNVLNLIRDINGNHVIQSIIENITIKEKLTPIYKEMNECLIEISTIKQGGCVFPKVLENILEADRNMLIDTILKNIDLLTNDEYGNFIVQRVIKLNNEHYNKIVYEYIEDKIVKLSSQKYSSNVVEACIGENINIRVKVIDKLIEKNNVMTLIVDQYGNYIVQKSLKLVKGDKFMYMIDQIKKSVKNLNQTGHGRKIFENLQKKYKDYLGTQGVSYGSGNGGGKNNKGGKNYKKSSK